MRKPILERHGNITVVRDDMLPGGTKSRFILPWMTADPATEYVYATPPEGGAQLALAIAAYQTGRGLTLFTAARKRRSPYTEAAAGHGARMIEVRPGYFSVVTARARAWANERGTTLIPFGLDIGNAEDAIATTAAGLDISPAEVWCACGSGLLARALAKAWPEARLRAVRVGRTVREATDISPYPFARPHPVQPPFSSNPYYDAKAWAMCQQFCGTGSVLFWNVAA